MKLASAKQMRDLDNEAIQRRGIPSIDLMERAAEGVAEAALALLPVRPGKARAAVLCGAGNNGGDGSCFCGAFPSGYSWQAATIASPPTPWKRQGVSRSAVFPWRNSIRRTGSRHRGSAPAT